jgi:hypothetical protein
MKETIVENIVQTILDASTLLTKARDFAKWLKESSSLPWIEEQYGESELWGHSRIFLTLCPETPIDIFCGLVAEVELHLEKEGVIYVGDNLLRWYSADTDICISCRPAQCNFIVESEEEKSYISRTYRLECV